ncbi:MAG: PIN domain-containing protein [Acidobacteriia bacterium]|nr:PIN domain-containing protein [Terriglobia bacterium]
MGVILDSTVLVAKERQGNSARQALTAVSSHIGDTEIAISAITLLELAHGAARANTPERKATRQQFIEDLLKAIPVYPVSVAIAIRAGQMDGENQARGVRLPLSDLLIAVTALEAGYSVATVNVRHFRLIPNLDVIQF